MKILSPEQIRDIDRLAIQGGIASLSLMHKAAEGIADAVMELMHARGLKDPVGIVAGKGNNGGDGFATAYILAQRGLACTLMPLFGPKELSKDALHYYRKAKAHKRVRIEKFSASALASCGVLVDAMLGTGFKGRPQGPVAGAIDTMNAAAKPIVAADIPSGLDADSGQAVGAVRADITVTMGFVKSGFLHAPAMNYVGALRVADLGIPGHYADNYPSDYFALGKEDIKPWLPRRKRISHKGDYGHVLLIAGSEGMAGAAILAARAALRSGAGLVTVACPEAIQGTVTCACPEAMTLRRENTALLQALEDEKFDALAMGPGMGRNEGSSELVRQVLRKWAKPLVLDADALWVLAKNHEYLAKAASKNIILTPHAGEFQRLWQAHNGSLQNDEIWSSIVEYSGRHNVIVVYKSYITAISDGKSGVNISFGGNAGMATAGMGDVLCGIIATLLGQGLNPLNAAKAGVFVHGLAGDSMAEALGQKSLIASDVIDCIPKALHGISGND